MKIALSNPDFVRVTDGKNSFYGGYQGWLETGNVKKFYYDRSCVVTAVTDIYFYLFHSGKVIQRDHFDYIQKRFFNIIRPTATGVATAEILKKRLGVLKGTDLEFKCEILKDNLATKSTFTEKKEFLKKHLSENHPLILFNWQSKDIDILKNHAVVVTGIDNEANNYTLTVSSWAKKYKIDLFTFDKQFSFYKALMSFEKCN